MATTNIRRTIDAVWPIESAKIIARIARIVGDLDLAEDLAQDALVIALERWPESGIPDKPGAWLMVTTKHREIDRVPTGRAGALAVPTLVMDGGATEWRFLHTTAVALAKAIPNGQHRTLKGQTHDVAAEVLAPVLVEFFEA